jgi:hypothetical protein
MSQNAAAAVIDLEAFRRRKAQSEASQQSLEMPRPVVYPVWVCWVPMPLWPIG